MVKSVFKASEASVSSEAIPVTLGGVGGVPPRPKCKHKKHLVCNYPKLRAAKCFGCSYTGKHGYGKLVVPKPERTKFDYERWWELEADLRLRAKQERFGSGLMTTRIQGLRNRYVTLSWFGLLPKNAWQNFVKRMREEMRIFEYAKVVHTITKGGKKTQHIHFVYRGDYLSVYRIAYYWQCCTGEHRPTVFVKLLTGNDRGLFDYFNRKQTDAGDVQSVRWSTSKNWAPQSETRYLAEYCIIR